MKALKLEFEYVDDELAKAKTPFWDYEIFSGRTSWCAEIKCGSFCIILSNKVDVTKEQAIDICQRDFESRVASCLKQNN